MYSLSVALFERVASASSVEGKSLLALRLARSSLDAHRSCHYFGLNFGKCDVIER